MRLLSAAVEVLLDPVTQLMTGSGTTEATAFLAVLKEDYRWETAEPESARKLHVIALVDLDLGQHDAAVVFIDDAIEMRRQLPAGCAPLGPEVDQDRLLVRGIDDIGLEVFVVYVEGVRAMLLVTLEMHLGCLSDQLLLDKP
jgi:hypothetical protein